MTQLKRRATYQYGTLVPEPRRRGPDIWVYRFFENRNGKRVRRKIIVGTLEELPKRADAERACENLRLAANAEVDASTPTMGGVIDRYIQEVLKPCLDDAPLSRSVSCIFLTSILGPTAVTSLLRLTEASGGRRGPEIAVVSDRKTIPAHAALLAKNIPSPRFARPVIDSLTCSRERLNKF